jgi:hypothetical protein
LKHIWKLNGPRSWLILKLLSPIRFFWYQSLFWTTKSCHHRSMCIKKKNILLHLFTVSMLCVRGLEAQEKKKNMNKFIFLNSLSKKTLFWWKMKKINLIGSIQKFMMNNFDWDFVFFFTFFFKWKVIVFFLRFKTIIFLSLCLCNSHKKMNTKIFEMIKKSKITLWIPPYFPS